MARFRKVRYTDPETGERVSKEVPFTPDEESARDAEEAQAQTAAAQKGAKARIRDHLVSLVQVDFPDLDDMEEIRRVLGSIVRGTLPTARSPNLTLAVSRYQYARSKVQEADGWTRAEADAYDPAADPSWPS